MLGLPSKGRLRDDAVDWFDRRGVEISRNGGGTWTALVNQGDITSNAAWTQVTTTAAAGSLGSASVTAEAATDSGSHAARRASAIRYAIGFYSYRFPPR